MSSASFTITYDGPALRDHAMDVRDLAPALLALGQLFAAATAALNGDSRRIKVQVQATERLNDGTNAISARTMDADFLPKLIPIRFHSQKGIY